MFNNKCKLTLKCLKSVMNKPAPKFGLTRFAETWNGRLAMIGFVAILVVEYLTKQGILMQLGLM
ncbi:MAG: high light inducible protein [Microcoleus sp. SIO2G3]|nr:high light inducible protein [Microcoleus sp. SIO2G3]